MTCPCRVYEESLYRAGGAITLPERVWYGGCAGPGPWASAVWRGAPVGGDAGAGSGSVSWGALSSSSESSLPLIGLSALARRWRDVRLRVEPFSNRTRYER